MVVFTDEELNSFTLDQLHRLSDYYQLPYTKGTKKSKLVEQLKEKLNPPAPLIQEIPTMSVRVRRNYERKLKGEL